MWEIAVFRILADFGTFTITAIDFVVAAVCASCCCYCAVDVTELLKLMNGSADSVPAQF